MILFDISGSDGPYIGMQREDLRYTYLHWDRKSLFKLNKYGSQIAGSFKGIVGIGPISLVEWPK